MELTPSSSSSSAAFAQQGTIDWTKLSSSTFSATLSILGRLSADGLEPLTVAVAQAMFLQVPIGSHGEQVLNRSIATLKSFSSFGQAVWFGVGVRHILHLLVQTSQGCASVALAACLTETHSAEFSAMVFYEMAKLLGSPVELSPSFSQWERYVKVCSGVSADTHFGLRVGQLARLAGLNTTEHVFKSDARITQPQRLAELLITLGQVTSSQLECFDVVGCGLECCWVACYCDFLLGLRVRTVADTGDVIFQNYDNTKDRAQVFVHITRSHSESGILSHRKTIVIEPVEFLDSWMTDGHSRDSAFVDTKHPPDQAIGAIFHNTTDLMDESHHTHFRLARVLALLSLIYAKLPGHRGLSSPEQFIAEATSSLPMLSALEPTARGYSTLLFRDFENVYASITTRSKSLPTYEGRDGPSLVDIHYWIYCYKRGEDVRWLLMSWYWDMTFKNLQECCGCNEYKQCLLATKSSYLTPVMLGHYLACVISDEDLLLSTWGVMGLHEMMQDVVSFTSFVSIAGDLRGGVDAITPGLLGTILRLFSGRQISNDITQRVGSATIITALSGTGFYAYFDILREPSSSQQDAARIHVGRGSIRVNNRPYDYVRDQDVDRLQPESNIGLMPKNMDCRALLDEGVALRFWYERWDAEFQNQQKRDSLNPMASLWQGWSGDRGPWPGGRTI